MQKRKVRPFTVVYGKHGKKNKKPVKIVAALLVVAVVCAGLTFAWFVFKIVAAKVLVDTVIAHEGRLEQAISTEGVLAREEKVVAAPASGTLRWLVKEGDRLQINTPVATITTKNGETRTVTTPAPGIVMLGLDGLEGVLQPAVLESADVSQLLSSDAKQQRAEEGRQVQQGSLLFKVVNNFAWYYVSSVEKDRFTAIKESDRVSLRFSFAENVQVQALVQHIAGGEDRTAVIFKMQSDIPKCYSERFVRAEWITSRTAGIILPASALIIKDEETGVYVLDQSVVRYRPVDVVETGDNEIAVKGIPVGMPVITTPAWVREGQKL